MNLRGLGPALARGARRAVWALYSALPDRWDALALTGAGLLGGGVWGQWGPTWACMLWGVLLLGVVALHAARLAKGGR